MDPYEAPRTLLITSHLTASFDNPNPNPNPYFTPNCFISRTAILFLYIIPPTLTPDHVVCPSCMSLLTPRYLTSPLSLCLHYACTYTYACTCTWPYPHPHPHPHPCPDLDDVHDICIFLQVDHHLNNMGGWG